MKSLYTATAAAALMLTSSAAFAQTDTSAQDQQRSRQQERLNSIFGALFGDRTGSTQSIEAQWSLGRTPLATQRAQFEARVDADVRSGQIDRRTGDRLKTDYYDLVQLEARYGADRRFTAQERQELAERYGRLTQVIADGAYGDEYQSDIGISVADGQSEFNQRVDAQVTARRITRVEGARLKTDYAALVRTEATYLRDGRITDQERDDLYSRLEALDARVGDMAATGGGSPAVQTPRVRLDAIARALPASGLSATAQAQLRVEHEDLTRLEAAYARLNASADERAYLDRRLTDLETRARVRR